jgi:hypothetical protein
MTKLKLIMTIIGIALEWMAQATSEGSDGGAEVTLKEKQDLALRIISVLE